MTIAEELKKLKITPKALREFGFLVGGIFLLIAGISLWRQHAHGYVFLVLGVFLVIPAFFFPGILRKPYLAWMTLAFMMGWVMTRVLLTVLFFLTMFPISLIARLTGHSFLDTNAKSRRESYWVTKSSEKNEKSYEKQY